MSKNIKYVIFLLLTILLGTSCFNYECKESTGNGVMGYDFEIPYSITPAKDTFKVGDTIWLESKFSKHMLNNKNNKTYILNNFDFGLCGYISDLGTNPCMTIAEFVMLNSDTVLYTEDKHADLFFFKYKIIDNNYTWKAGFIMQRSGLYAFGMDSDYRSLRQQYPRQQITDCDKEFVHLYVTRHKTRLIMFIWLMMQPILT